MTQAEWTMGEGPTNWRHAMRTLATWSPVVVLIGLAGMFLAPAVADVLPIGTTASATVGLTEHSDWPFHEANLIQIAGALDDGTLLREAERSLGLPEGTGSMDADNGSFASQSVIRVRVTSDDPGDAADLANEVAVLAMASRPEVPVRLIDRADIPGDIDRPLLAGSGLMLGLLAGLALIPALDRTFGRVMRTDHPEFAGRVARWVDLGHSGNVLPVQDSTDRLVLPIRTLEGPIAVLSVHGPDAATSVAKTLSSELAVEINDGGSVNSNEATEAVRDSSSVVLVVDRKQVGRRTLDTVVRRLETLGAPAPIVVLRSNA